MPPGSSLDPLFVFDGDRFIPGPATAGPWDPDAQHGGPPSALLARCIERHDGGEAFVVVRTTVELLRPVPLTPLAVSVRTIRPGRKVQLVEASLWSGGEVGDGTEVCRAVGLRIRRRPVVYPDTALHANDAFDARTAAPGGPETGIERASPFAESVGFVNDGAELLYVAGSVSEPGPASMWVRLRRALVDDEEPSGLVRAVAAADFGNALGSRVSAEQFTYINPDLTVSLHRHPSGQWIFLAGHTGISESGLGAAYCDLSDVNGPVGRSVQSMIIADR